MAHGRNKPAHRCFFHPKECHEWEADCADADVDTLVWEALRAEKWKAEVSSGLGRCRWKEWRSPANRVGNLDGDGKK